MKEHVVDIKGHKYRYIYVPETQGMKYLGPVGDAPEISEDEFMRLVEPHQHHYEIAELQIEQARNYGSLGNYYSARALLRQGIHNLTEQEKIYDRYLGDRPSFTDINSLVDKTGINEQTADTMLQFKINAEKHEIDIPFEMIVEWAEFSKRVGKAKTAYASIIHPKIRSKDRLKALQILEDLYK
jgi:hypothetical protein